MKTRLVLLSAAGLAAATSAMAAETGSRPATSCVVCHQDPQQVGEENARIAASFATDVHAEVGLSCHDCHGGNPDPAHAADMDAAMDPHFAVRPYVGAPARGQIPAFCARCHSDPTLMKRFKPDIRVDQEQEYWTSQHGIALKQGNTRVATCIDCHGVHGIMRAGDPRSSVYPTRVAETCRKCHGDPEHMRGSTLPDGSPLPVDQYSRWRQSVHAKALLEKEDLSAPTCNDCHGNHGAAPPGLNSIAFVCGQCHGREAELFRASRKHAGYEEHNRMLARPESSTCVSCHSAPSPQATVVGVRSFSECVSCHGNHGVVRPTIAMLAQLPETPCAFCHEGSGPLAEQMPEPKRIVKHYQTVRDGLLAAAAEEGLAGDARFDWLVDQALALPTHTVEGSAGETGALELRPEFEHLFSKFRIGKSYTTYEDPVTGAEVRRSVARCSQCHEEGVEGGGLATAGTYLERMRELTALTARGNRLLLTARRGGVETRLAQAEIEGAVNAQIELEVLVHSFASDEASAFSVKHREGLAHAEAALRTGQSALQELEARRLGLYVALGFIGLVLAGLAIKIQALTSGQGPHPAAGGKERTQPGVREDRL